HVPVVLLTNGIAAVQRSRLARSPLRNWISEIVISQEAGISKPDPEIFRRALGGVAPRNGLMIGDGIYSDLRGANLAGVDVCWYNPRRLSLPEGIHAEYTVRSLKECLPIALMPDR
ncbi:MAG: HAD-IA family hydrolase, partial [Christensenellales bacterium]|nr:HAD-IA family hydrolase [Christensenellales bacterium]